MAGNGWQVVESDSFERGALQCGGLEAIEEIIAPIKLALTINPFVFPETSTKGTRIAKTKLHFKGSDIVLAHTVWFRAESDTSTVELLWIEVTDPTFLDDNSIW